MHNKILLGRAGLTPEFENGVKTFTEWAKGQRGYMDGDKIKCPCRKCKNKVSYHLCMRGFMLEYYNWTSHGEECVQDYFEAATIPPVSEERTPAGHVEGVPDDGTRSSPVDAGPSSNCYGGGLCDYDESGLANYFYNILHIANHPLWNGCTQSQLSVVAELVDIKVDGHIFERIYDLISQWANILPSDHTLSGDYYNMKKLVKDLSLPIEKIDAYDFVMRGQYGRTYSCCPVIITPYNLLPGVCMSFEYMFLTMVIPGPSNPKRLIDVYLKPLIEELMQLRHVGVRMYDHATYNTFIMLATLMWTVNDLPTYGMRLGGVP
ncbi:hypothetical protein Sango_0640800 [Sesamum angolense]|uniref:Transposase-associated domain-containing protein n=1 Tax=Sesamum angolense TaxID=2727404 RepID=A0AAE1X6S7_9LAMI|nr:hypothetical protein Sango_0640800 [Sesamum angolense]